MIKFPSVLTDYFPLRGGLNLVTPPLSLRDGSCRDALNFEMDVDGGYRRIGGYERFSGQAEPSAAFYSSVHVSFSAVISAGNTITGLTSGASGYVIAVDETKIYITKQILEFQLGEAVQVAGVTKATVNETQRQGGAPDTKTDVQYTSMVADIYRNDIGVVPGSGAVLGVWKYNDQVYAFRNTVDGMSSAMYQSSSTGWMPISLGYEIYFTNANLDLEDGDTLTQGASTALISRVVVQTGTLQSGVNTGKLILSSVTGTFAAGVATSTGGGALTLSGDASAITILPNGRYEFVNNNFGGAVNTKRMYGVSGVNRAFEFDGTVFVPIDTGNIIDTPSSIAAHNNYLFLSFGGSLQYSSIGEPYRWQAIAGAGELAMGDSITGLLTLVGSQATQSLAVFTVNKTAVLYGSSPDDYQLVTLSYEAGGMARTMQNLGDAYVFDVLGVRQLSATDRFGNFAQAQVTRFIRPFINLNKTKTVGSCIVRSRDQYRLLFNNQFALYFTFNNAELLGVMPIRYAHFMTCMASFEEDDGEEFVLSGGTNGYVYRMDKGTSFDGEPIEALVSLAFSYARGPRTRKRYRKAVYEFTGNGYAEIEASYELGYGNVDIANGLASLLTSPSAPVFWDGFTWDSFFWDGKSLLPIEQEITGSAENISLVLRTTSDMFHPFTVNSAIIHYTPRRNLR